MLFPNFYVSSVSFEDAVFRTAYPVEFIAFERVETEFLVHSSWINNRMAERRFGFTMLVGPPDPLKPQARSTALGASPAIATPDLQVLASCLNTRTERDSPRSHAN
jgi:hypothetical protein